MRLPIWYNRKSTSLLLLCSYRKIKLESNCDKTSDKFTLRDILQSNWAVLFKNVKVMKDKEKQEMFYSKAT